MQELDIQPTNPTPYTPVRGTYNINPTPGAGGLPALSGLNNRMNPMVQELQSQGRGDDTMLVHMTPDEVNSLQGLAMQAGTTMTINPNTGLPEAGLLGSVFKKLLPTLLGAGLAATGVGAPLAAGLVGIGSTALTGSLKKGLMAGLGAYGGASLAGAAGLGGSISKTGFGTLGSKAGIFGANMGAGAATAAPGLSGILAEAGKTAAASGLPTGAYQAANPGFFTSFANTAKAGLPGIIGKAAPVLAASGVASALGGVDKAIQQGGKKPETPQTSSWVNEGPYMPTERVLRPRLTGPGGRGEIDYFYEPDFGGYLTASGQLRGLPQNYTSQRPLGFAEGGSSSRTLTPEEAWANAKADTPKPIEQRVGMIDYAGDPMAYRLMSEGITDSKGNVTQFSGVPVPGMKAGATQDFGGKRLELGQDMRWYVIGNTPAPETAKPATTDTTKVTDTTTTTTTPRGTDTATKVTDTTTTPTTRVTDTATATTGPTRNPEAGPSGYGVKTLDTYYTPQFTKVADYMTEKVAPYTGGTEQLAKLDEYTRKYQTSPGPITASLGYGPGQSPSQRNRAYALQLAKEQEEEAARQRMAASNAAMAGTTTTPNYAVPVFNPVTGQFEMPSYARGGIHMDDGAFVVDARTVSELGNGSSSAGQELLARLGGRPVKGPGDGVSDSIRANIGGTQEARVARDEVIFPAKAVKKLGGAKKLYALMDKAHKARKKAGRGTDTKLRKGLGAL